MKTYLGCLFLCIGLSIPPVAAENLEQKAMQFQEVLSAPGFDPKLFCVQFWKSDQIDTCETAIPWDFVRSLKPTFLRSIPTQGLKTAFSLFKINDDTWLLTATRAQDTWFFSMDDFSVWRDFSQNWQIDAEGFEARFAEPIESSQMKDVKSRILDFHSEISKTFGFKERLDIPFYFNNSQKVVNDLGWKWPQFSGGARNGFVLITGDLSLGYWSTLLHELVHMYTAFPGTLWHGSGIYPNAAFSEGLASWFQYQYIWEDGINPQAGAKVYCESLRVADLIDLKELVQILDDNYFRALDRRPENKGYFPAYVSAAGMIDYLMKSMSQKDFEVLWNQIGESPDFESRKKILLNHTTEEKLQNGVKVYFQNLGQQIFEHTQLKCLD